MSAGPPVTGWDRFHGIMGNTVVAGIAVGSLVWAAALTQSDTKYSKAAIDTLVSQNLNQRVTVAEINIRAVQSGQSESHDLTLQIKARMDAIDEKIKFLIENGMPPYNKRAK